ncbi:MAG: hypothetical protein ACM32I_08690 [Nitrospirota bacterium]
MELDVRVGNKSIAIPIENPFRLDIDATAGRIESFLASESARSAGLDFRGLLPKMIKGIAGCEGGCPADAKRFVSRGFTNFKLEYIEGGILHAQAMTEDGKPVSLKMFPDF